MLHGRISNDPCFRTSVDRSLYDGHLYADKAPGLSLIELPAVAILQPGSPNDLAGPRPHALGRARPDDRALVPPLRVPARQGERRPAARLRRRLARHVRPRDARGRARRRQLRGRPVRDARVRRVPARVAPAAGSRRPRRRRRRCSSTTRPASYCSCSPRTSTRRAAAGGRSCVSSPASVPARAAPRRVQHGRLRPALAALIPLRRQRLRPRPVVGVLRDRPAAAVLHDRGLRGTRRAARRLARARCRRLRARPARAHATGPRWRWPRSSSRSS